MRMGPGGGGQGGSRLISHVDGEIFPGVVRAFGALFEALFTIAGCGVWDSECYEGRTLGDGVVLRQLYVSEKARGPMHGRRTERVHQSYPCHLPSVAGRRACKLRPVFPDGKRGLFGVQSLVMNQHSAFKMNLRKSCLGIPRQAGVRCETEPALGVVRVSQPRPSHRILLGTGLLGAISYSIDTELRDRRGSGKTLSRRIAHLCIGTSRGKRKNYANGFRR